MGQMILCIRVSQVRPRQPTVDGLNHGATCEQSVTPDVGTGHSVA
jgi:hypothetical protein